MKLPKETLAVIGDFERPRKTFEEPLLLNEKEWARKMKHLKSDNKAPEALKKLIELPDIDEWSHGEGK